MLVHEINGKETAPSPTISTEIWWDTVKEFQKIPPDISEKLQKLGLTVTPEVFQRIQEAGQEANFQSDLSATLANPSEKWRIEQLWLKGYWQIVTIDWIQYTFAKIAWMDSSERKRLQILKKLGEAWSLKEYQEWSSGELEAANQKEKKIDKQLIELDKKLKSQISDLQSINWVPKPTPEELKKNAQNIPELKWVPIEEIQSSDKYNNILLADYYVRNATEIGRNLNPQDTKKFRDSINSLSDTLGRPRIEKFDILTKEIVLGENRGKVESMGKELIKSGYSPDVLWNPQDRTMTFTNEKWEKRIIDTAKVPPTERLKNGAIEVSKELEKPKINIYITERQSSENRMNSLIKNAKDGPVIGAILWSTLLEEWWKKVQEEKNPLERTVLALETLGNKRRVIKEIAKKAEENGEVKEAEILKEALPQIDKQIQDIIAEWQKLAEVSKKEKEEEKKTNTDNFGDVARQNIEWLQKLGLSGFMDMSEVTGFLSSQNSATFGWEFSDKESINTYLGQKKLNNEQYIQLLSWIVTIYQNITGTKELQNMERSEQVRFLTRQTENGKTRLENAINSERIKQDGRPLNPSDFKRILANTQSEKSETK